MKGDTLPVLKTHCLFNLETHIFDEAQDGVEELGEGFKHSSHARAGRHRGLGQLVEARH